MRALMLLAALAACAPPDHDCRVISGVHVRDLTVRFGGPRCMPECSDDGNTCPDGMSVAEAIEGGCVCAENQEGPNQL